MIFRSFVSILTLACAATAACACVSGPPLQTSAVPSLPGRAVFQGVDSGGKGQLYLFDFATLTQQEISLNWGLTNPINAQFSPDGHFLVFAAHNAAGTVEDVYVWPVGAAAPQNLTKGGASGAARSEDPKWRFDEKAIVFKQDGNIKVMSVTISGTTVTPGALTSLTTNGVNGTATEASAPFFTPDAKYVYFTRNSGASETVHVLTTALGQSSDQQFNANANYAYYPTVRDYTAILYTGWTTATGRADQILLQSPLLTGTAVLPLPFNDCNSDNSDPAPVDTDYVLYSNDSAAVSPTGGWRPVLATYAAAKAWNLSRIGLGAGVTGNLLGLNYTAAR